MASLRMQHLSTVGNSCHKAGSKCGISRPSLCSARPAPRSNGTVTAPLRSRQLNVSVNAVAAVKQSSGGMPTVKVVLQGRRLEITEAIKAYVEDKVSNACAHFTRGLKQVDVTMSARGGDTGSHGKKEQKVEVTIHTLRNGVVRVEETESSLYAAIDLVCDKIERKLSKVKEMAIAKGRWHAHASQAAEEDFKEFKEAVMYDTRVFEEQEAIGRQFAELNKVYPAQVRRTKKVELDLMTVDEAIDAMEAVGHDFFVFREMESDTMQVVYRRQSDGYGILVPVKRE